MDLKLKLLDLLERAYGEEQAFVRRLSDEERSAVGAPGQWSAKDTIAHIAAWKERTAQELAAVASGESGLQFDGLARFNARTFEEHHNLAWSDVLNKSKQAHRLLQEQTQAMPNDVLTESGALEWHDRPMWWLVVGRGYTHPLGHLSQCYVERDNINYAVEIQERAAGLLLRLDESSDWRGLVHYRLATYYAGLGQMEKAIGELREAFRLDPRLVERAKEEPCLAAMRENPEYHSLHAE